MEFKGKKKEMMGRKGRENTTKEGDEKNKTMEIRQVK